MRLLKLSTAYAGYVHEFYGKNPVSHKSYQQQLTHFAEDAFSWFGVWGRVLPPHGYEVEEILFGIEPLQYAWAKENGYDGKDLREIALLQVKQNQPDILWYDCADTELIKRIRDNVPSIRRVMGWCGSAIPKGMAWNYFDCVLSCAPESVKKLRDLGCKAYLLRHAFDATVLNRIQPLKQDTDVSFVGQVLMDNDFHLERARILTELSKRTALKIFSASCEHWCQDVIKYAIKVPIYAMAAKTRGSGIIPDKFRKRPVRPVGFRLRKRMRPALYGIAMLQQLSQSRIGLNIHADSSPEFASNMRLFEITGVGSCMVLDHKKDIGDHFRIDSEVVTYKCTEECVEKISWLLKNPIERNQIAAAGQKKTIHTHNFENRACELDTIIRQVLG